MSTRILPHNFGEVIAAMCAELNNESFELLPDFATGGLLDASQYNGGNGTIATIVLDETNGKFKTGGINNLYVRDICCQMLSP